MLRIYTDGGVIGPNPSSIGGTWAFCFVGDDNYRFICRSGVVTPDDIGLPKVSNNITELYAVLQALNHSKQFYLDDPNWGGVTLFSDSYCTLRRVFHRGSIANAPPELVVRARAAYLYVRQERISYQLLAGHPTLSELKDGYSKRGLVSEHNVFCDNLCTKTGKDYLLTIPTPS